MRLIWTVTWFLILGLVGVRSAPAAEDDTAWKSYVEAGSNYVRAAEDATNARDRRDNIERAAGQFQAAVNIGRDKSAWRPIVMAADGYVRMAQVATGNDRDNYTDLAISALDSATGIAKAKADRTGLREVVRVYRRLARNSAGAKLKAIEAKIKLVEQDAEGMPEARERRR
jgi:hypothetical protein